MADEGGTGRQAIESAGFSYPIPVGPAIITITPEMAAYWLENYNKGNRHLSETTAKRYATAMLEGRWKLTHQGIAFDAEGFLLDGQHRLLAVVLADTPAQFWVLPNCDRGTFDVLDAGRRRQAGHLIDHPHRAMIAAAARFLGAIDGTLANVHSSGVIGRNAENDQITAIVAAWPELLDFAQLANKCYRAGRISGSPHLAVLAQASRTSYRDRIPGWAEGIVGGAGLPATDPRLHLRNRFMREANWSTNETKRVHAYGLVVTAWNYWATGRPMSVLKTVRDGQPIPPIVGRMD